MVSFKSKKVAVIGLGIEGIDAVKFLSREGADITILDQKNASLLGPQLDSLGSIAFKTRFGKSYLDNLRDYEVIFRSPSVRVQHPRLLEAKKNGSEITSNTIEFFNRCPGKIIGVTGTKGKGTTATLISLLLKTTFNQVSLAGNIGLPMLELLPGLTPNDWVVLELSSFQLQDLQKSPHIAVVTNITSDHLDYHLNREEYIEAKASILNHQTENDFAVVNFNDPTSKQLASGAKSKIYYYALDRQTNGCFVKSDNFILNLGGSLMPVAKTSQLKLIGRHNWSNVAASILASSLAGSDFTRFPKVLSSFPGLKHRLEFVKNVRGVNFYNDSFGTTPDTAMVAIDSFSKPLILIAGGSEKGADFTALGKHVAKNRVKVAILIGKTADAIKTALVNAGFKGKIITGKTNMSEIVESALLEAVSGDIVLLSPACASFDMFNNYKERGDIFCNTVNALKTQ